MTTKMWFHPARLSNRWAFNKIQGVPVMFRWQWQPCPPRRAPVCPTNTIIFHVCQGVENSRGGAINNLPQAVQETHWRDFISIISNLVHWHFTWQLEIFHLVYLLAYLDGYISVYILTIQVEKQIKENSPKGQKTSGQNLLIISGHAIVQAFDYAAEKRRLLTLELESYLHMKSG